MALSPRHNLHTINKIPVANNLKSSIVANYTAYFYYTHAKISLCSNPDAAPLLDSWQYFKVKKP